MPWRIDKLIGLLYQFDIGLLKKITVSSANWLIPICLPNTFNLSKLLFLSIKIASISTAKMNRRGEMGHPCLIPREVLNLWDVPNESEIKLFISLYNIFIIYCQNRIFQESKI